jgi:hypothetical protein
VNRSVASVTPALVRALREQHDDGQGALRVRLDAGAVEVTRADGSELSDDEARHVAGILAAHAAEPIRAWAKNRSDFL